MTISGGNMKYQITVDHIKLVYKLVDTTTKEVILTSNSAKELHQHALRL